MLRVRGLGLIAVEDQDHTHYLSGKAAQLLGALLATDAHKRPVPRSQVAGLLWPNESEQQGRSSLSRALSQLRQQLPSKALSHLVVTKDELGLQDIHLDRDQFLEGSNSKDPNDWKQAADLYQGRWLDDLDRLDIEIQRESLHQSYIQLLQSLAQHGLSSPTPENAIPFLHRWMLEAPYEEHPHQEAMKLYARLGHTGTALWLYRRLHRFLLHELEIEPTQATQQLARSIKYEHRAHSSLPPFWVGRDKERAALLHHAGQATRGKAKLVLVEGPPGIGKSHLLHNLADSLKWRGFWVASGKGEDLHGNSPYHPWESLLQSLVSSKLWSQTQHKLAPSTQQQLQHILQTSEKSTTSSSQEVALSLTPMLHQTLKHLTEEGPVALLFDDVQWSQPSFWELLLDGWDSIQELPIFLVLSYRSQEMRQSENWNALEELDLQNNPLRLQLSGFSQDEAYQLLHHEAQTPRRFSKEFVETVVQQTQGNPLHLVEIAHQWQSTRQSTLEALIQERFFALSESARDALEVATVMGPSLSMKRWQALLPFPLSKVLPAMLTARLLRAHPDGHALANDTTRSVIYKTMTKSKRVQRHAEVVELLQGENTQPEELLWHLIRAEQWNDALDACQEAMKAAANVRAYASAQALAEQGLTFLKHLPPQPKAQWDLLHEPLYFWGGPRGKSHLASTVEKLQALLPEIPLQDKRQAQTYRLAALVQQQKGETRKAITILQEALTLPGLPDDPHYDRRVRGQLGQLYRTTGQYALAKEMFEQALQIEDTDKTLELALRNSYALVWLCSFHFEEAKQQLKQLLPTDPEERKGRFASAIRENLTEVAIQQSRPGDGWPYFLDTIELAKKFQHHRSIASSSAQASQMLLQIGAIEKARAYLQQAEEAAEFLQESQLQGTLQYTLSLYYAEQQQWEDAKICGAKALSLLGEHPSIEESIQFHWHLGYLSLKLHDAATAQQYAQHLQTQHDPFLAPGASATGHLLLAGASDLQNKVTTIRPNLEQALQQAESWPSSLAYWSLLASLAEKHAPDLLPTCRNMAVHHIQETLESLEPYPEWRALFSQRDKVQHFLSFTSDRTPVSLVKIDVPLGKKLTEDDYCIVHLTLDAGENDEAIRKKQGKAGLRRHRIVRMMEEAKAQGALCNDQALAELLEVSVRTIERDMTALRKEGHALPTRRRHE